MRKTDVVVIGAGAAGLAAARRPRLNTASTSSSSRRATESAAAIFTHRDSATPVPIELGAEFIHGGAPELDADPRTRRSIASVDIGGRRWQVAGDQLRPLDDFWQRLEQVMRRLDAKRPPDRSFAGLSRDEAWRTHASPQSSTARTAVRRRAFTPPTRAQISERALAAGRQSRRRRSRTTHRPRRSTATIASSTGSPHRSAIGSARVRDRRPAFAGRRATFWSRRAIPTAARGPTSTRAPRSSPFHSAS